ncbi:MAG: glycosyltransferase family 1 protein, partial [Verrucomicrobia bacterium]|nr:glycosyltransferase family 1 protein [Verrucomicrobiota bacterium]
TPQLELLKRTSVCITHAGLNTVLESLAEGVPQVAIPITFDQPGVAARIVAKKTGVTMPFEKLTSDRLSTLLREVLSNAVYRENARKFQDVIAKTNGLCRAADLVEQALGVPKENSGATACTKTKECDRILQPQARSLPFPEAVRIT